MRSLEPPLTRDGKTSQCAGDIAQLLRADFWVVVRHADLHEPRQAVVLHDIDVWGVVNREGLTRDEAEAVREAAALRAEQDAAIYERRISAVLGCYRVSGEHFRLPVRGPSAG
jgi:hypothetical protein